MQDENNEEGQRYIAEQIAKENIEYSHRFAMEHMPEGYFFNSNLFNLFLSFCNGSYALYSHEN